MSLSRNKQKFDDIKCGIVVLGASQHGKSSFLNLLLDEQYFPEGDGNESKTKARSTAEHHVILEDEDVIIDSQIYMTDTPGIIDSSESDLNSCVHVYNAIMEINPLNGIFIVIKFDTDIIRLKEILRYFKDLVGNSLSLCLYIIFTHCKRINKYKDDPNHKHNVERKVNEKISIIKDVMGFYPKYDYYDAIDDDFGPIRKRILLNLIQTKKINVKGMKLIKTQSMFDLDQKNANSLELTMHNDELKYLQGDEKLRKYVSKKHEIDQLQILSTKHLEELKKLNTNEYIQFDHIEFKNLEKPLVTWHSVERELQDPPPGLDFDAYGCTYSYLKERSLLTIKGFWRQPVNGYVNLFAPSRFINSAKIHELIEQCEVIRKKIYDLQLDLTLTGITDVDVSKWESFRNQHKDVRIKINILRERVITDILIYEDVLKELKM